MLRERSHGRGRGQEQNNRWLIVSTYEKVYLQCQITRI
jgi:hypothetical protein